MKSLYQHMINYFRQADWMLLLFLVLFLNVKLLIKTAVLVLLLLILWKQWKEKKIFHQKFIWFYFCMITIALLNLLTNIFSLSVNYLAAAITGIGFWAICIGAASLNYWFVNNRDTNKLHITISLFFILNALFTIGQLILFMWDSASVNPYTYQGMNQKYFIGTGDLLTGITFDVSTTNALLNAFAVVYFLDRDKIALIILCMTAMLLTASNFTIVLLLAVFFFLFLFQSNRNQKSVIVVCLCLFIIFFAKISPQNKRYFTSGCQKLAGRKIAPTSPAVAASLLRSLPDSILNAGGKKKKLAMLFLDSIYNKQFEEKKSRKELIADRNVQTKPSIPKPNIHTEPYQRKKDTSIFRKNLIAFAVYNIPSFDTSLPNTQKQKIPGKLVALQQTIHFLKKHPFKVLTGSGIGQFSSKLAFRTTTLQVAGNYPIQFTYINNDFRDNHLDLYLNYFTKDQEVHSVMNTPDSVYDQLLAEYGLLGIIVFLLFYVGYFFKTALNKSYALPLLMLMLGAFAMGYWFEQLSIVILFELMMLLNNKETKEQNTT